MLEFLDSSLGIISSIIGILAIGGGTYYYVTKNKIKINGDRNSANNGNIKISNGNGSSKNITVYGNGNTINTANHALGQKYKSSNANLKSEVQILFIDDEEFNVIRMLRKSGWKNIKRKNDFANLDDIDVKNANVIFVDIKGVGIIGGYKNEGIGLAAAIKEKYPEKGVIIYSGTHEHNIFDEDIDIVDARLPKNAEPIQFSNLIELYGTEAN